MIYVYYQVILVFESDTLPNEFSTDYTDPEIQIIFIIVVRRNNTNNWVTKPYFCKSDSEKLKIF